MRKYIDPIIKDLLGSPSKMAHCAIQASDYIRSNPNKDMYIVEVSYPEVPLAGIAHVIVMDESPSIKEEIGLDDPRILFDSNRINLVAKANSYQIENIEKFNYNKVDNYEIK
jgi:hypothetical protein